MKKKILLIPFFSFFVFSCHVSGVDSLYLGTVKIQTVVSEGDLVPYPNVDFAIPSFISGLVQGFNEKQENLPSDTRIYPPIKTSSRINNVDLVAAVSDNQYTFLKNNFTYSKLSDKSRQTLLQKGSSDFWLSLDLKTNLWQQRIWGTLVVYLNGDVFYRKHVDVSSKYIILDKDSPYASSLDKQLNIKPKGDYQEEIKYIYKNLGFLFAQKMKKDFIDVAASDEYKRKQKEIRAFYDSERKSTTSVPDATPTSEDKEKPSQVKKQESTEDKAYSPTTSSKKPQITKDEKDKPEVE